MDSPPREQNPIQALRAYKEYLRASRHQALRADEVIHETLHSRFPTLMLVADWILKDDL